MARNTFDDDAEGFDEELCDDLPEEVGRFELNQCLVDDTIEYCTTYEDEEGDNLVCIQADNEYQEFRGGSKEGYLVRGYVEGDGYSPSDFSPSSKTGYDSQELRSALPNIVESFDDEGMLDEVVEDARELDRR